MVYIDTETTGLYIGDEIVEIAIINDDEVLLNSLVKPVNHTCWPDAQESVAGKWGISQPHRSQPVDKNGIYRDLKKGPCVVV